MYFSRLKLFDFYIKYIQYYIVLNLALRYICLKNHKMSMAFERIKTVDGHQYKYLVENKWENGKVKQKILKYLCRVDKGKPTAPELNETSAPVLEKVVTYSENSEKNGYIFIGRHLPLGKYRIVLYELPKEGSQIVYSGF